MRIPFLAAAAAILLTACSAPSESGSFDRSLNTQTAGVAVAASFAKLCGGKRIDAFENSYVRFVKSQRPLTAEAEAQVRDVFTRADAGVAARFDDAARAKQCADYPLNQAAIDRGIAGDFTGLI
ncbi:hypothetical protein ACERZ8_19015 [Tateyamaria armeniaca]|uniref:Lipoprotein n=1 Tax=Tateyamaria armeniaca TaxID=2518930 RepID=A0ABW8V1S4_9RHOB